MELIASLVLIPFLVGLVTNRADALLLAPAVDNFLERFRKDDQGLEKVFKRCFLSALQNIAIDCHKELLTSSSVQRYRGVIIYSGKYSKELQWLDAKVKHLALELKNLNKAEQLDIAFQSVDDIALILTSDSQIAKEKIELLESKLIIEALGNSLVPELYEKQVKLFLIEKTREQFYSEIKHNPGVKNIIETRLLANINESLSNQNVKIKDLEASLYAPIQPALQPASEARRRVKMEFDIADLDAERLEAIVQHLHKRLDDGSIKLRRVEEGCMELIFDGSQESLEKLDALFKSGKITEILGIPIKNIQNENSQILHSQEVVNLAKWLQNIFDTGWETVEDVLDTSRASLVLAARSIAHSQSVIRARQITLEMPQNSQFLNLVVDVIPETNQEIGVCLQLHPGNNQIRLPEGLIFSVLDLSGEVILESQARDIDNWIQLDIGVEFGDKFIIKITLEDTSVVQYFEI
jgi:Protein of unknown function (DUF1822)